MQGTVLYGGKNLACDFVLVYNNMMMNLRKSKVTCKPKPKKTHKIKQYSISSEEKEFKFSLKILKTGKGIISMPNIQNLVPSITNTPTASTATTSTPTATKGINI